MLIESFQNMYPSSQSFHDTIISIHNHTSIDDASVLDTIHDYFFVFFFVFLNGFRRFNFLEDNDFVFDF
jgi:hypothetical protein